MNIETINHWGQTFLSFAWPMLWQSSLLIAIVFALDFLLARKIRASVRHALWLVVLVKLMLPPTLALPTSATWWLWPAKPEFVPVFKNVAITYSTAAPLAFIPQSVPPILPPPRLNGEGWALLAGGAVSTALLLWLGFNWLNVAAKTRRPLPNLLADALEEARKRAGWRGRVRLKLVEDSVSPAVFGLFRPVILLPRALAKKLSPEQLRTVLLHETIHVRRGDVWVNCAQTLLQIAYWWHPLLWLANARIRRLREEAVDDAVMAALDKEAEVYAPTLLEVAKFAFRRPLASLGLVGILESRSALRQRVERLVDFRPPRKAGLTVLPLCLIFAFGAVALPMGQSPAPATDSIAPSQPPPPASASSHPALILMEGRFLWIPAGDLETLTDGLPLHHEPSGGAADWLDATNATMLAEVERRMKSLNLKPLGLPRAVDISGNAASFYVGDQASWFKLNCTPTAADGQINLSFQAEVASVSATKETNRIELDGHNTVEEKGGLVIWAQKPGDASSNLVLILSARNVDASPASRETREDIFAKLDRIHMGASYQDVTLGDVLQDLAKRSQQSDPDGTGIPLEYSGSQPDNVEATEPTAIHITLALKSCTLGQILDAVCMAADYPINYSVRDGGVMFRPLATPVAKYEMRTFKIDPHLFYTRMTDSMSPSNIPPAGPDGVTGTALDINYLAKEFFKGLGVHLDPPKTLFYNGSQGMLYVYATPQDLDVVKQVIGIFAYAPPQIHIKARFFEMPSATASSMVSGTGILTADNFKKTLALLKSQKGVRELAEPEATTISGRQTEMTVGETVQVVTNYSIVMLDRPHVPSVSPQMSEQAMGEMFNVVPWLMVDGYTINLTATASRTEFFGYADPKGFTGFSTNFGQGKIQLPVVLPAIQVKSGVTVANIYDGQTLVLFANAKELVDCAPDEKTQERVEDHIRKAEKKYGDKTLVVLVTITLIDPAGNRAHTNDQMAFAQNGTPPQPRMITMPSPNPGGHFPGRP